MESETKWCPDCQALLPLSEFVKNRTTKDGHGGYCRPHQAARGRASTERNGGSRKYHIRRRYGVDVAEIEAMEAAQGGLCKICRKEPVAHIDHSHATGLVRGVLCFTCNMGVANFKEDPATMRAAADYIESGEGIMPHIFLKKGQPSDSWAWKNK